MNLTYLLVALLVPAVGFTNPIKNENLNPTINEPVVPGTKVPVEDLNTAPTSAPSANNSEAFRGTLKSPKIKKIDSEKKVEKKKSKVE